MKRILADGNRIACTTDKKLTEIYIDEGSLVGHIINGVVKNILPSRFAFIDIGQPKNAFMNIPKNFSIKPGQYIPVQVRKDATGEKGANVSEILKFKGKYAILYIGNVREIGVSNKIELKAERERLKQIAEKFLPKNYSCVLRTQANGVAEEDLTAEFSRLSDVCQTVLATAKHSLAPKKLYYDNFLLNDLLTDDVEEIILSSEELFNNLKGAHNHIVLWKEKRNLFDAFDIERQIGKALHRNVWLPCGGFVTFDQVEACVVIDVNTGKFLGKKNYQETVLKVNLEAAKCIAEQIALRNLSGMIIIDFIDMTKEDDKNTLLSEFKKLLQNDRIPAEVVGMTTLGLVQLTRRKQREPLGMLLQKPCPHCAGSGRILASNSKG